VKKRKGGVLGKFLEVRRSSDRKGGGQERGKNLRPPHLLAWNSAKRNEKKCGTSILLGERGEVKKIRALTPVCAMKFRTQREGKILRLKDPNVLLLNKTGNSKKKREKKGKR